MRSKFLIFICVVLLGGCSSTAASQTIPNGTCKGNALYSPTIEINPAPSTPAVTNWPQGSDLLNATSTPIPVTQTPQPTADTFAFPPHSDVDSLPALDIGRIAVADDRYVYYYNEVSKLKGEYVLSHDAIYRMDRKTGRSEKIRDTDTYTMIQLIFLDGEGNLYYLCDESEDLNKANTLFRYSTEKDVPVVKDVIDIYRVDSNSVYFVNSDNQIMRYIFRTGVSNPVVSLPETQYPEFFINQSVAVCSVINSEDDSVRYFMLDLKDGQAYPFKGKVLYSENSKCLVDYCLDESGMTLFIYDFKQYKKSVCRCLFQINNISSMLMYGDSLYIIDSDQAEVGESINNSMIYRLNFQTGSLISTIKTSYVKEADFCNNKWYLYTCVQKANGEYNPSLLQQKVQEYDPNSGKLKPVASLSDMAYDDDQEYTFEVAGGYAWMIDFYDTVSSNRCWKRVKLP